MYGSTSDDSSPEPTVSFSKASVNEGGVSIDKALIRRANSHATLENVNYARISCLLMQEGTKRMQVKVIENLPERQTLAQVLDNKRSKLNDLRKSKFLTKTQYDTLFPFSNDLSRIDISLWLILARNITVKNSTKGIDWGRAPESRETHWAHDLVRLKEFRNFLFHVGAPELTNEKFNEVKQDLFRTLRRLGTPADVIDDHMNRDLDPLQTQICQLQIREQYIEEQNILLLKSVQQKKHTTIFTGVLVILVLLVIVGVSVPVAWYLQQKRPCTPYIHRISSDSGSMSYMDRKGWGAAPSTATAANPEALLKKPVKKAVVFHTANVRDQCRVTEDCCDVVKEMQARELAGGYWTDVAYNYLIGDDGVVYEGRGSDFMGAASWHQNEDIVSIALIGNYACARPSQTAMVALYVFLEYITVKDPSTRKDAPILHSDYELYGHCQVNIHLPPQHNKTFPDSPGAATMNELMYWNHWRNDNLTQCSLDKDCVRSSLCCKNQCNKTIVT